MLFQHVNLYLMRVFKIGYIGERGYRPYSNAVSTLQKCSRHKINEIQYEYALLCWSDNETHSLEQYLVAEVTFLHAVVSHLQLVPEVTSLHAVVSHLQLLQLLVSLQVHQVSPLQL